MSVRSVFVGVTCVDTQSVSPRMHKTSNAMAASRKLKWVARGEIIKLYQRTICDFCILYHVAVLSYSNKETFHIYSLVLSKSDIK